MSMLNITIFSVTQIKKRQKKGKWKGPLARLGCFNMLYLNTIE